jgi:hypothetical protein
MDRKSGARWRETPRLPAQSRCRTPWTRGTVLDNGRLTHNPEVAGSNPAPATRQNAPGRLSRGAFFVRFRAAANQSVNHRPRNQAGRVSRPRRRRLDRQGRRRAAPPRPAGCRDRVYLATLRIVGHARRAGALPPTAVVPGPGQFHNRGCHEDQGSNDRTHAHRNKGHACFGLNVRSGNWGRRVEAKRFGHMVPAENFQVDRVPAEYPDDAADPAQPPHRHSLHSLSPLPANFNGPGSPGNPRSSGTRRARSSP